MNQELHKLIEESDRLQAELMEIKTEKQSIVDRLKHVESKIEELKNSHMELVVSDHAIVRYLERVENLDIEAIKKKIVTEKVNELINKLGNGVFPVNDTFKITVNKKVITTVLLNSQKTSLSKKPQSQR